MIANALPESFDHRLHFMPHCHLDWLLLLYLSGQSCNSRNQVAKKTQREKTLFAFSQLYAFSWCHAVSSVTSSGGAPNPHGMTFVTVLFRQKQCMEEFCFITPRKGEEKLQSTGFCRLANSALFESERKYPHPPSPAKNAMHVVSHWALETNVAWLFFSQFVFDETFHVFISVISLFNRPCFVFGF